MTNRKTTMKMKIFLFMGIWVGVFASDVYRDKVLKFYRPCGNEFISEHFMARKKLRFES